MTSEPYKHIFGPVLSRRLGRSLGLDIMPFKTCTYDCIYCEQGRTTHKTSERGLYVPVAELLGEVKAYLAAHPAPDFITVSAAGEPTLHTGLGEIIHGIKTLTPVNLAVITNGALLWDPGVRAALQEADVVMPSLDAGNARLFTRIDRPETGISFERMLDGLIAFRDSYLNAIWLEVMLIDGMNSEEDEVLEIAACVRRIRPDRVQLNTVVRPPAFSSARPVSFERLEYLAGLFEPRGEVIAHFGAAAPGLDATPDVARVLSTVERRPCPPEEISAALGIHPLELSKLLQQLVEQGRIEEIRHDDRVYFAAVHKGGRQ